jgi:hypothetical protein
MYTVPLKLNLTGSLKQRNKGKTKQGTDQDEILLLVPLHGAHDGAPDHGDHLRVLIIQTNFLIVRT